MAARDDVVDYLRRNHKQHRELPPREIITTVQNIPEED
jgi:hypothetical protein